MRTKKLLSLILALCMVFTTVGSLSIVNAATVTTTVNVGQGTSYSLPADITWEEGTGTTVDTSKIGYQIFNGTDGESNPVTYRVNVGEYKEVFSENFNNYPTDGTAISNTYSDGSKFTMGVYSETNDAHKIVALTSDNNVLQFGAESSQWSSFNWDLSKGIKNYKITFKAKIEEFILNSKTRDQTAFSIRVCGDSVIDPSVILRIRTDQNLGYKETQFRCAGDDNNISLDSKLSNGISYSDGKTSLPGEGETETEYITKSMNDWLDISIEGNEKTFNASVNDVLLATDETYARSSRFNNGIKDIAIAKRDTKSSSNMRSYIDDFVLSELVYVTDDITTKTVTDTLAVGDATNQEATVTLAMSDGKTKDFAVNYTADTSSAGVKTATGMIGGFSEPVTVSYSVKGVSNETINTYVGANVTLADGTKADTSTFGRKKYNAVVGDTVTKYTVNTGDWTARWSDDLERHSNGKLRNDNGVEVDSVIANNADGFNLSMALQSENTSGILADIDGDNALKFAEYTYANNAMWSMIDELEGSFKVKLKLRVKDFYNVKDRSNLLQFRIFNNSGEELLRCVFDLPAPSNVATGKMRMKLYSNESAADGKEIKTADDAARVANLVGGKYDSGWMIVEFVGNSNSRTFDIYVDGVATHTGFKVFRNTDADVNFGSLAVGRREKSTACDAIAYIDDIEIYQHNCFTGELPENLEIIVGQGESAPQSSSASLILSNGGTRSIPATVSVDSSRLGNKSTKATLEGFDETVNANVKVCNYHISDIGYKKGNEFTTAPVAEGSIATALVTNKGGRAGGETAVFAWYNDDDTLAAVKKVTLPVIEKNAVQMVEVGLSLPKNIVGGELKVFIFNNFSELIPVDLSEEISFTAASVPTVFMAGDSTMEELKRDGVTSWFPKTGIGQVIEHYFVDGVEINNYAKSGLAPGTYISSGRWNTIMNEAEVGDYVIISFGHNCYSETCTYDTDLEKMAKEAQGKGLNVIMYSPIVRLGQQDAPTFDREGHKHITKMKAVSDKYDNITYFDMTAESCAYLKSLSSDSERQKLYMQDLTKNLEKYTSSPYWANSRYNTEVVGDTSYTTDISHFTVYGANVFADKLSDNIKAANILLSDYIKDTAAPAYPALDRED